MPFQIQNCRSEVLECAETLIELAGLNDFSEQICRNRLTSFVMAGKVIENVRLNRPVFLELSKELNKVARCRCTSDKRIGHVRKQVVHGVSHLVKHRCDIVETDQGWFSTGGFGIVQYIDDEGLSIH